MDYRMINVRLSLALREIELTSPKIVATDKREDPPYERSGRVIPVTGAMPMFIPILIKVWKDNIAIADKQKSDALASFTVWEMLYILQKRIAYIRRQVKEPTKPNSSEIEANIKSV